MVDHCTFCGGVIIIDDARNICSECGRLHTGIHYTNLLMRSFCEPIHVCVYQRKKRFIDIVRRVISPDIHKRDEIVLKKLIQTRSSYSSVDDILFTLKRLSTLRDKRYGSLHVFCKHLVKNYVKPVKEFPEHMFDVIGRSFEQIELAFIKHSRHTQFFNYNWLLKKLLHYYGFFEYDKYIKNIRCQRRNLYYEKLFTTVCTCESILGRHATNQVLVGGV